MHCDYYEYLSVIIIIESILVYYKCKLVLTFIAYALAGNGLVPVAIFTLMTLCNSLYVPVSVFSSIMAHYTYGKVALERVRNYLLAEEIIDNTMHDYSAVFALQIKDKSFIWETTPPISDETKKSENGKVKTNRRTKRRLNKIYQLVR